MPQNINAKWISVFSEIWTPNETIKPGENTKFWLQDIFSAIKLSLLYWCSLQKSSNRVAACHRNQTVSCRFRHHQILEHSTCKWQQIIDLQTRNLHGPTHQAIFAQHPGGSSTLWVDFKIKSIWLYLHALDVGSRCKAGVSWDRWAVFSTVSRQFLEREKSNSKSNTKGPKQLGFK